MGFELWQLFSVGVGYLGVLFAIAYAAERRLLPEWVARHPLTYTLSLGVYATSWSFYGSVGFAQSQGYNFLTIYLGVTLAFILAPVLLQPILRLTRDYQLSSLADLFSFRYHSQLAGVLVTLFMLAGTLPYIALQVRAVAGSLQVLTREATPEPIALGFCLTVTLFSILFGARHISPREKHEGLVVAIAFESLIKLTALIAVGLFALFGVFGGPAGMEQWLARHPEALSALYQPVREGPWGTLLLLSFAAAFLLPRQFHMTFVENIDPRSLSVASWAFPLFLLALNLAIPPILWAGSTLDTGLSADFYVLGITLESGTSWLPLLTFIGGISAASAMIIVTTLSLAAMAMNHLVLPASFPPRLDGHTDLYRWLLWGRRLLIGLIIAAGYGFYLVMEHNQGLAQLGLISFVAVAQLLPGIAGLLYWRRATRAGFIVGLLGGGTVWAATLLLPLLERSLGASPMLDPVRALGGSPGDPWSTATFWSLGINALLFVTVSLRTRPSDAEREAAASCCREGLRPPGGIPVATSVGQFREQLARVTGEEMAAHEVESALCDLGLSHTELTAADLGRLRERIARNLSGLVGPLLARMIVDDRLQLDTGARSALADTVRFVEQRLERSRSELRGVAAELDRLRRYHRQVLEDLPLGACAVGPDGGVVNWNGAMAQLTGVSAETASGTPVDRLPEPWGGLLLGFLATPERQLREVQLKGGARPRVLNLHKAAIEGRGDDGEGGIGGSVILVEDLSDLHQLEAELSHSERLASIGRLAAGVAHEIGNPVTGIACLTQELISESDDAALRAEGLAQILEQTRRISNIVQTLVTFSHGGGVDRAPAPLHPFDAVDEAVRLVRLSRQGKQIEFINRCPPEATILGDPQRLVQLFVNLLTNAADASHPGDAVEIEGREIEGRLEIAVIDHGHGIPEAIVDQIFDPFFTTKEPGEGTGLGLAMVYNIVRDHAGTLTVQSEAGAGSRFTLRLPMTE